MYFHSVAYVFALHMYQVLFALLSGQISFERAKITRIQRTGGKKQMQIYIA